ncbi:MAG: ABC transporter permease [Gammaproteobacteria bacterium]|nr:ABC transporter permease [Gammaproteobacteria bacterium]
MNRWRTNLIALGTIVHKEIGRFLRIWLQTIVPPAITMALYFIVFGQLIGPRVGAMGGYPYLQYLAPGLIMMAVITNAYANVVSSFFSAKFQRHIEEMLVAPVPDAILLAGYVIGGIARGLAVGVVVTVVALFFTDLKLHSLPLTVVIVLLTATLFSVAGFINGIHARNFDDVSVVPTFVLTPLTYLGGVFYSIDLLPDFWRGLSHVNPVLYMVNAFRYGFLGVADIKVTTALLVLVVLIVTLTCYALWLLRRGIGLRS